MTTYSFTDGALLALLLTPPALLYVTARIKARRSFVATEALDFASDQWAGPAPIDELRLPLIAMQEQVDMMSRAHSELLSADAAPDRVSELEAEVNEAAAWIADLLTDRDRRLLSESRLQTRLEVMSAELDRLRDEREAELKKSDALALELSNARTDIARLGEMLERSEMEKRALEDELGTLTPRVAELLRLLNELTAERDHLRRDLAVAQGALTQHHRATLAAENVLERALQDAPIDDVHSIERDVRNLRAMQSERGRQVSTLTKRLATIDLESTAVRDQLSIGRPVVERIQGQLSTTRANAHEITQALSNARHRIERLHRSTRPRNF